MLLESSYNTTMRNNESFNEIKRELKDIKFYLEIVLLSPTADREDKDYVKTGLDLIPKYDSILKKGYLSSGYQYDADSIYNKLDAMGDDGYQDREQQRTGSGLEDEIEAQIRHTVVCNKFEEHLGEIIKHFDNKKSRELFNLPEPEDKESKEYFDWDQMQVIADMSLGEFINNSSYEHDEYQSYIDDND